MENKNSYRNNKSITSGFENIGKFYKHYRKKSKEINNKAIKKDDLRLKAIHQEIYMLLVEYSFGYMNNINLEISMSIKQLMTECFISNKTAINSIAELIDSKLISRVKWQQIGPKQIYKYRVAFPDGYNIDYKETLNEETTRKREEFIQVL